MPITTVAVTCTAARPDGSLIAGGKFRFLLSNTDTENGLVVPREISATANASGVAVANLWPNSLGALGTQYRVLLTDPLGSTIDLGSCTVPNSACNLHAILGLGTAPTLDQATVAKLAAQTAAAASSTSATQSVGSATQAATSATAAAGSATAAAASQTAAAGSVTSAANSATAAGNSATSAASSNTAAGASATSAASSAADALSSKNAAATSATNSASNATAAQTSATNAATSATTATTKASEAATSASNASTSATAALASQNAAATSETNAQGSATTAATQASNAASSATNAASSASSAASSLAAVAAVTTGNMSSQNANAVAVTGGAISGTSITVADNVFTLQDNVDPTKQAQFQLSGLVTGTLYTFLLPTSNGGSSTLVDLNSAQIISASKTFTGGANIFGSSSNTYSVSLGVGATASGNTKTVNIGTGGLSGSTTNITVGSANGSTTTMLGSTVIGGVAGSQSLQVNSVASAVNYAQIVGAVAGGSPTISAVGTDASINLTYESKSTSSHIFKGASGTQFVINDGGGGTTTDYVYVTGSYFGRPAVVSRPITGANVNLAVSAFGLTGVLQFMSNNTASIQAQVTHTASAVNYLQLTGAATGAAPTISAQGSDANIGLVLTGKGTGLVALGGSTVANSGLQVSPTASSVNYIEAKGAATGQAVYLSAQGSDANIPLIIQSKGTQPFYFVGNNAIQFATLSTASAVNYAFARGSAAGSGATIGVQGSDTNIDLLLSTKGTGVVALGGTTTANSGLQVSPVASSVNYAQISGNTVGFGPIIAAAGTDANIAFTMRSKGTFGVNFQSSAGSNIADFLPTFLGFGVNFVRFTNAITGSFPDISAQGSDANINLKLTPKGTGVLQFGTYTAGIIAQAGYITITDAGGTSRRLLVG